MLTTQKLSVLMDGSIRAPEQNCWVQEACLEEELLQMSFERQRVTVEKIVLRRLLQLSGEPVIQVVSLQL